MKKFVELNSGLRFKVWFYLTRNFRDWLDFLFYGVSRKQKNYWLGMLHPTMKCDLEMLDIMLEIVENRLPKNSEFVMRVKNEVFLQRRDLKYPHSRKIEC